MITQVLHCPHCQGIDIVKNGKTSQGKQRFLCREKPCDGRTFLLDYSVWIKSQRPVCCRTTPLVLSNRCVLSLPI